MLKTIRKIKKNLGKTKVLATHEISIHCAHSDLIVFSHYIELICNYKLHVCTCTQHSLPKYIIKQLRLIEFGFGR